MNIDVNSAKKADYRRVWGFFLPGHRPMTHRPVRRSLGEGGNTSPIPIFPASGLRRGYDKQAGPATRSFNGLHPKRKFLAFIHSTSMGMAPAVW